MTGTVIHATRTRVIAWLDGPGRPSGNFSVVRHTDGTVLGTVTFRYRTRTRAVFHWDPIPNPMTQPRPGDLLQPAG